MNDCSPKIGVWGVVFTELNKPVLGGGKEPKAGVLLPPLPNKGLSACEENPEMHSMAFLGHPCYQMRIIHLRIVVLEMIVIVLESLS